MKVLIVSPCILPVPAVKGGAVLTLVENLISQNENYQEMELTVVGSYNPDAEKKSELYAKTSFIFLNHPIGCDAVDCCIDKIKKIIMRKENKHPHTYLWKLYVISQVKKILKKNDFDKVVFQNSGYLLKVLKDNSICNKYKGKLFYHLHNDIPGNVYVQGVLQCKLLLISEYLKKNVIKLCDKDFLPEMLIVKNGFDCSRFTYKLCDMEKNEMRKQLKIEQNKKIVLFAGRIAPTKGIKELVAAITSLDRDDIILLVVGSYNFGTAQTSSFEQEMKAQFKEQSDRIRFTGFVPYLDMWKYYKLADLAVLPSMWEEPAGLAMLEAATAELPVITTNAGGIPEYLNPNMAILLNRDNDIVTSIQKAIVDVIVHKQEWVIKGKEASSYVCSNFNANNFYNDFIAALKKE